jgi:hypothetical protein
MGDFVLTSLRSPSLAGAVGRQIQGRLGGSHGPDGAFTGAFFVLLRLSMRCLTGEPIRTRRRNL